MVEICGPIYKCPDCDGPLDFYHRWEAVGKEAYLCTNQSCDRKKNFMYFDPITGARFTYDYKTKEYSSDD